MPRHPVFRAFVLLGAFASGVATLACLWVTIESLDGPRERVRAVVRFDPSHRADPETELEEARRVIHARLESLDATDIETRIAGEDEVGFDCRLPIRSDADEQAATDPGVDLDPSVRALLEQRGDVRFLAQAESADLVRLGTDLARERESFDRWRRDHPTESVEGFNALARENGGPPTGLRWYPLRRPEEAQEAEPDFMPLLVPEPRWRFRSADLESARPGSDRLGYPAVEFELTEARRQDFGDFTESLVDKGLAIVVSGEIVTVPQVEGRLPGGGIIAGGAAGFTLAEARDLIRVMRAGELPSVPVLVSATRSPEPADATWIGPAALGALTGLATIALLVAFVLSLLSRAPDRGEDWSSRAQDASPRGRSGGS